MSDHTPGPWEIRRSTKGYAYAIRAPNGKRVKDVTRWAAISVPSLPEGEANARLIAAAPEMLTILQWLNTKGGLGYDVHDRLHAIIAKATGNGIDQ